MADLALPTTTIITGSAGWLGRALVHHLARADGDHRRAGVIRALVLDDAEAAAVRAVVAGAGSDATVETVVGSVTEPASLAALFGGADGDTDVIHTAGVIHPGKVADFFAVNADGTRNVVAAAVTAGVRRFVHVSSNSPFGANPSIADTFRGHEPYNPYLGYGESKMQGRARRARSR